MSESHISEREKRIIAGALRKISQLHTEERQVPERRRSANKESLHRRNSRKHDKMSERKNSPEGYAKSWFHSKSGQT